MADTLEGHDSATGASIPHPEDPGALWERLTLGPYEMPGTWVVGGDVDRRIDVKKSKGNDGARFRDQGYIPGQITLSGRLLGPTEWNAMVKIAKILTPRKRGVNLEPLAVEHPAFTFLGITNVIVKRVGAPVLDGSLIRCRIVVIEWTPRPKKKPPPKDAPLSSGLYSSGVLRQLSRSEPWRTNPSDQFLEANAAQNAQLLKAYQVSQ